MNLKKLLTVATLFVTSALGFNANAQASYNFTYNEGVAVTEGTDYFLYNVGAKRFLTDGMDWGTHATVDNAGRVITLAPLGEAKYSIYTKTFTSDSKSGYMTLNGYLDTGSNDANWEFTSVELNGYTNVYTIKHSDSQYLYYDNNDSRVQVGNSTENEYSYWMLVPKTVRDTKGDYTYLLQNTDFNRPWERVIWNGFSDDWWNNQSGGLESNRCAEFYTHAFNMTQDVNYSLPKGLYTVSCQGFYRTESGEDSPAVLYANSEAGESTANFNKIVSGQENSMGDASTSFSAGNHAVSLSVVMEGNFTVGIKNTATNWVIFDNFSLKCEGIYLSAYATPFTGTLEAGKWYEYDVVGDGAYDLSVTDGIVYTQNDVLMDELVTSEASSTLELTKGKLFIKSATAQDLTITPKSYSYVLGDATMNITEGTYIKDLTTFVVSYAGAATSDPDATLVLFGSPKATLSNGSSIVAEGTITADNASKALTATFADVTLDLNSTYTITIPAGVFGYEGEATNEEVSVNFNTPVIADGYYYMYNTETESYLSRGGVWATSAILDDWGLAVYLKTDVNGNTSIKYFDSQLYLCDDEYCYTDAGEDNGRRRYFKVSPIEGGYNFLNTNNSKLLAVENGVACAKDGLKSNVWQLVKPAKHHAENYTRNANAQAAAAATAATNAGLIGLSEITTVSALESYLDKLGSEDINIIGADEEKFEQYAERNYDLKEAEYYKETVPGLKPGLYKLSVDAFQRAGWKENVAEAEGARGSIYVYANEAKTQIKSFMEYGADDPYGEGWPNYAYNGKNYPNDHPTAKNALKTGNYRNDVYVYVADGGDGTGSLTFGINNPNRLGDDINRATWAVYNNFTLTYYGTAADMTITEAGWATFIAPFEVEIPEGVTAYTVAGVKTDNYLNKAAIETGVIPANTPVLLEGAAMTETFYGQSTATQDTYGDVLVGNVSGVTKNVPNNGESFVLLKQGGKLGFYKVATDDITVGNNRCYLNVPAGGEIKAFFFDDEATGINGIADDATVVERYNAAGMKVAAPVKGLNIVKLSNGKVQKVLVK